MELLKSSTGQGFSLSATGASGLIYSYGVDLLDFFIEQLGVSALKAGVVVQSQEQALALGLGVLGIGLARKLVVWAKRKKLLK